MCVGLMFKCVGVWPIFISIRPHQESIGVRCHLENTSTYYHNLHRYHQWFCAFYKKEGIGFVRSINTDPMSELLAMNTGAPICLPTSWDQGDGQPHS